MRGVGISGVSGTGKLELATAYAAETDYMLVPFSNSKLLNRTRRKFTTAGILEEYTIILAEFELAYADATKRFITNMTPLDAMTELYSIFAWHNEPSEEIDKKIKALWSDGCRICSKYLSVLMYIQPLNSGTKEEHINALGAGLIHTRLVNDVETQMFTIRRNMVELDKRLVGLKNFVYQRYEEESPYIVPATLRH